MPDRQNYPPRRPGDRSGGTNQGAPPHGNRHNNAHRGEQPHGNDQQGGGHYQGNGGRFHNPYTFVPTPSRGNVPAGFFAGDYNPLEHQEDHSRLWPDRYTGDLPITLTVKTPLFIAKTPEVEENAHGHKIYDCVDEVPATTIKGMLRSAYEAITNSRYGVFNKEHEKRLGLRLPAESGVVPARVIRNAQGNLALRLYCGESYIGRDGRPANDQGGQGPQYAAWIPTYLPANQLPQGLNIGHAQKVNACIVLCRHQPNWNFWRVVSMAPAGQRANRPPQLPPSGQRWDYVREQGQYIFEQVEGYVVRSGRLISNKHDERLFYNISPTDIEPDVNIPEEVQKEYNALLEDYRKVHDKEAYPPSGNGVVHGAHITSIRKLQEGDFVYASFLNPNRSNRTISKIFPVQISRDLHEASPWDCLDESLRPPRKMEHLSPAERLFGWVNAEGKGAWRGKVRIVDLETQHPDMQSVVEKFPENQTLPLAILGAPKPSQARFYLGNADGLAQGNGLAKREAGYRREKSTRGRKMYIVPKRVAEDASASYWQTPWQDRTRQNTHGYFQEYRQPNSERSNQNRSITGWIRPGTEVSFNLRVENLTLEELGALLMLVELNDWAGASALLRLGMGKPLGLGCLKIGVGNQIKVAQNRSWQNHYKNLNASGYPEPLADETLKTAKTVFMDAMRNAYAITDWNALAFVKAFKAAANGPADDYPVHYPRTGSSRYLGNDVSPSFKWFVTNERQQQGHAPGIVLPNAWNDAGLPYNPSEQ